MPHNHHNLKIAEPELLLLKMAFYYCYYWLWTQYNLFILGNRQANIELHHCDWNLSFLASVVCILLHVSSGQVSNTYINYY